ncbi:MAG: hypothetical protein AB7V46_17675 [Thermomicrobiales bacterium]
MQNAVYVRIYADDQGESHFEDMQATLTPGNFAPPAPPLNIAALAETRAAALVGGEPSWQGDIPHPTPRRQLMCILSGSFATTASDGETRIFRPGDLLLLEDVDGKGHVTRLLEETVVLAVELQ